MTLEEPIVEIHIAFGHDATPTLVLTDFDDAIEHQHRRRRQTRLELCRRVLDEPSVRESKQFGLVEVGPGFKRFVFHRSVSASPKRARYEDQVNPEPTPTTAISSPGTHLSQFWESTVPELAAPVFP